MKKTTAEELNAKKAQLAADPGAAARAARAFQIALEEFDRSENAADLHSAANVFKAAADLLDGNALLMQLGAFKSVREAADNVRRIWNDGNPE